MFARISSLLAVGAFGDIFRKIHSESEFEDTISGLERVNRGALLVYIACTINEEKD